MEIMTNGPSGSASAPSDPYEFDLSGGALCLDFTNTVGDRPRGSQEHLQAYSDLLSWSRQTEALQEAEEMSLAGRAEGKPEEASEVFARALVLRETIYRIFSAVAEGRRPPAPDLAALNQALKPIVAHRQVLEKGDRFGWIWSGPEWALDRMLWPVLYSTAELLTSLEVSLVRECASDRCSWLFVDRSRTHRRRWCDMKTCGNRAKARRHYRRRKQDETKAPGPEA